MKRLRRRRSEWLAWLAIAWALSVFATYVALKLHDAWPKVVSLLGG